MTSETLVHFDTPVQGTDELSYDASVCGRLADDGLWDGWIEFRRVSDGVRLRSPRETRQPDRGNLMYWAGGLTVAYLEGALDRALRDTRDGRAEADAAAADRPRTERRGGVRERRGGAGDRRAASDRPAPLAVESEGALPPHRVTSHAVLNPFEVYAQGEDILRQELSALSPGHLRTILRDYSLGPNDIVSKLQSRDALVEMTVNAVRSRVV